MKTKAAIPTTQLIAAVSLATLGDWRTPAHMLFGERSTSFVTPAGTGVFSHQTRAVTRWKPDLVSDCLGHLVYVRDLDSGQFWSFGYQPTCVRPDAYEAAYTPGTFRVERRDQSIVSRLDVCLAPTTDFELRRCTLTNEGSTTRSLELTSYTELVLHDAVSDHIHPAFSKLFVETELHTPGVLLARRRPRQSNEVPLHACYFSIGGDERGAEEWETDRRRFIGRGHGLGNPAVLLSHASLSGTVGSVLDPIFSLRKALVLPPGETVSLTYVLGASTKQSELLQRIASLSTAAQVDETFTQADQVALERYDRYGLTAPDIGPLLQIVTNRMCGLVDEATGGSQANSRGMPWRSPQQGTNHEGETLGSGQQFWQRANELLSQYQIRSPVHVRAAYETFHQADFGAGEANTPPALPSPADPKDLLEDLQFANGMGGFSADGREYVIHLQPGTDGNLQLPPLPWNNVISSEYIGCIASETGAGYTWAGNSRLNRLTPWSNEPILDPHGEACYLRDRETGEYWSLTPGPIPRPTSYEVRHGWGYTAYQHTWQELDQEVCHFVPRHDPVKIVRTRVTNHGQSPRRLSLYGYAQWELCDGTPYASAPISTTLDEKNSAVFAVNPTRDYLGSHTAFAACVTATRPCASHLTADRTEFVGRPRSLSNPLALESGNPLTGRAGSHLDPCAALQTDFDLAPGDTAEFVFLLGETPTRAEAEEIIERYCSPAQVEDALSAVKTFWADKFSIVQVESPAREIDLLVNGWLPYQNISCRLWGRSSSCQSGGAYGFRDQLQDAAALIHHCPQTTREQILRNAAHQFVEGDVLHWWHPPKSIGIRTNFADDLLWLPLATCEYVLTTGDESIWQEEVRFLTSEPVPPGEPEIYLQPSDSGTRGTLYEHCCRALDRGLTRGNNGLPLMGSGDWNDGMNRIGHGGSGESVWMGFFIDCILERMLPVCKRRGDTKRVDHYSSYRAQLREALNDAGWDGSWYRRAYFDDGTPVGTAAADECQLDALVQAWAVLSGVAPPERARAAIAAVEQRLVDEQAGLIRLLDPPFNKTKHDPGYIKGYLPGIRENGGQYTHGILWLIRAIAELGEGTRACELLSMISPISHGCSPETVATYLAEPYVVAADVYSQPPHAGRAGWPWYTGSAGWMWRVAVESILGIHLEAGKELRIDPRISAAWPEFRVRYRLADGKTCYKIHVSNPEGQQRGVRSASADGQSVAVDETGAHVPLTFDGREHEVLVEM